MFFKNFPFPNFYLPAGFPSILFWYGYKRVPEIGGFRIFVFSAEYLRSTFATDLDSLAKIIYADFPCYSAVERSATISKVSLTVAAQIEDDVDNVQRDLIPRMIEERVFDNDDPAPFTYIVSDEETMGYRLIFRLAIPIADDAHQDFALEFDPEIDYVFLLADRYVDDEPY